MKKFLFICIAIGAIWAYMEDNHEDYLVPEDDGPIASRFVQPLDEEVIVIEEPSQPAQTNPSKPKKKASPSNSNVKTVSGSFRYDGVLHTLKWTLDESRKKFYFNVSDKSKTVSEDLVFYGAMFYLYNGQNSSYFFVEMEDDQLARLTVNEKMFEFEDENYLVTVPINGADLFQLFERANQLGFIGVTVIDRTTFDNLNKNRSRF